MEFKSPWVLLLLIAMVPAYILFVWRRRQDALHFSSAQLWTGLGATLRNRLSILPSILRLASLCLLLIALAGPRIVLQEADATTEGIDMVLALDCSLSMAAEDFQINGQRQSRFDIIKQVVEEFINKRSHDRIGLVVFGGRAYTVCPLTTDYDWLKENLKRVKLGIVEDGTAIGSGISSALSRLKQSQAPSKVIIVLTDGMNNAGKIEPLAAAQAAREMGVKVYTIGAGTKGLAPYPVTDMFGRKFYQNIQIDIDEDMMTRIAQMTSAQYFRATDTESLRKIYKDIDALEKTKITEQGYREYQELFGYFIIAALILLMFEILLSNTVFLKIP